MIQSAVLVIEAAGHAVDLVVEPFPPADPVAALQAAIRREGAGSLRLPLIYTGVHSGPIALTVEVLEEHPGAAAPDWEDVHEVSLTLPAGRAFFNTPMASAAQDVGSIANEEKGSYRVRLHASGRDAAFDLVVDAPTEQHLVQLWKEPASAATVISSRSERGTGLLEFIGLWQAAETPHYAPD